MTQPPSPPPFELVEWLDATENQLADAFEQSLEDDATLDMLAQAWRGAFTGAAMLPPKMRSAEVLAAPLARGTEPSPGTLGAEYPTELFRQIRMGWSAATRAVAFQQAFVPFAVQQAQELHALAQAIETAPLPELAPTPSQVIQAWPDIRLRRIAPAAPASGEPIVIVSSLINRWYVLDLLAGHSFVAMLVGLGRPVYVAEWIPPQGTVDERSLGELCAGPLKAALEAACAAHDARAAAVIGYSMGGTLAAIFAARYPERVSRLATVCSPIRFDRGGVFTRWLSPRYLEVELIAGTYEQIPASIIHLPFWWLRPTIKTKKLVQLSRSFQRPGFLNHFLATEVWNFDNVDLSRGVFRSWAGDLYQRNALVAGQMEVEGARIDLGNIRCPVLAISGSEDKIVPPEAAEALVELVKSPVKKALLAAGCHHVRVLTARRALEAEQAEFRAWLEAPAPAPRR